MLLGGSINGVDASRFRPAADAEARRSAKRALGLPPDAPVLGFVGRVVREKGVVELCEAWRALREELPDLRLVLVGPREPQDLLPPEVVAALETDPRVLCAGRVSDTPRWFAAMDLVAPPPGGRASASSRSRPEPRGSRWSRPAWRAAWTPSRTA